MPISRHYKVQSVLDIAGHFSRCLIKDTPLLACQYGRPLGVSTIMRYIMTSPNGSIFRVTGPLWWEVTGEFPSQRAVTRSFVFSFICS